MEKLTLFEMEDHIANLVTQLDELVPDDDATWEQSNALEQQITDLLVRETGKVDAIGRILDRFETERTACFAEADRLRKRGQSFQNKRERLVSYVLTVMMRSGTKRLDGLTHTLRRQQNPPHVDVADVDGLPSEYQRVEYTVIPHGEFYKEMVETTMKLWASETFVEVKKSVEPDKGAIRDALKDGTELPGASLVDGAWRLVIR